MIKCGRPGIAIAILLAGWCAGGLGCGNPALQPGPDGGTGGSVGGGLGGGGGHGQEPDPTDRWQLLPTARTSKADILFMVDNSQSMLPLQGKLLANFPPFIDVLKQLPGGLPDLHIAVISSDTGPGRYDLPERHCALKGDGGRFQFQPRASICATAALDAGQTFIRASSDQQVKNYTGDITDAFTCIAALGDQGCGFEGQLKSVRWALDPANVPPGNEGFLRPDALLAVILITNEDDCSMPDDSDLADPTQTLMSSLYGPLWSFRCNEFGHLCNINGTLQHPPRGPSADLQGCVSNDGPTGKLTKIVGEVAFLKSLKADPQQLMVAAITGPTSPYGIDMIMQGADIEQHPNVRHSCTQTSGEYADPAVRIAQWVEAFGGNGSMASICAPTFAPALTSIAQKIANGPSGCVAGPFVVDPVTAQPSCRVVDRSGPAGMRIDTLLPSCATNGNTPPCWSLQDDLVRCPGGKVPSVNRGNGLPPNQGTAITCQPCALGSTEIGCQ